MEIGALGKGVLTAIAVLAVLGMLRYGGLRLAALSAAIPVTSAPALYWLALDRGAGYAAQATVASIHATGLTAVLALAFAWTARRVGPMPALTLAMLVTLMTLLITHHLATSLITALCFAVLSISLVRRTLPHGGATPTQSGNWRRQALFTAVISGSITALVTFAAPRLPPLVCGLLATIPVVGVASWVTVHRCTNAETVGGFLRAYVGGLWAKLAFLLALSVLLTRTGPGQAWLLSAAIGVATLGLLAASPRAWPWMRRAWNGATAPARSS